MSSDMTPKRFDDHLQRAQVYTIALPQGVAWEPERASSFMQHLLTQFGKITFCIVADQDQVVWQVIDLWLHLPPDRITRAIQAAYPEAWVAVSPFAHPVFVRPFFRNVVFYTQRVDFIAPMVIAPELKKVDPLTLLVQSMSNLQPGEQVMHLLHVLAPISPTLKEMAHKRINQSQIQPWQLLSAQGREQALGVLLAGNPRAAKFRPADQQLLENRLAAPLYNVFMMTQVDTVSESGQGRLTNLMASMLHFSSDFNGPTPVRDLIVPSWRVESAAVARRSSGLGVLGAWFDGQDEHFPHAWSVLSAGELAALWHLPHAGFITPEITWRPAIQVPMPAPLARNHRDVRLGKGFYGGNEQPVWMLEADRDKHILIEGKTGQGKSTLMHHLIHQDIQAGHGVWVIDPKGQLVRDILRCSIPYWRIEDVVVIDITNTDYPPPLNLMLIPGERNHQSAGQIVSVLDKVYDVKAQRAEDSLIAALTTLWPEPTPTVRDVSRLFTDVEFRHRLLGQVEDVLSHEYWDEFERHSESKQLELASPVRHRIRHFYRNPVLYPMVCHPDSLNIADLIARQKIVLVSLWTDERMVPQSEQQLLGAALISQVQMAIMGARAPHPPVSMYIDESQHFTTTSLDRMLAEARSFGLRLTLANQYLAQLQGKTLESVMGNVGAMVVFETGLSDARLLEPYFQPGFRAQDLLNLCAYHAAVKMRLAGQTLPAFSLQTLPPPGDPNTEAAKAREAMIRRSSIERYTPKTRQEVLAWLDARYPRPANPRPPVDDDPKNPDPWSVS